MPKSQIVGLSAITHPPSLSLSPPPLPPHRSRSSPFSSSLVLAFVAFPLFLLPPSSPLSPHRCRPHHCLPRRLFLITIVALDTPASPPLPHRQSSLLSPSPSSSSLLPHRCRLIDVALAASSSLPLLPSSLSSSLPLPHRRCRPHRSHFSPSSSSPILAFVSFPLFLLPRRCRFVAVTVTAVSLAASSSSLLLPSLLPFSPSSSSPVLTAVALPLFLLLAHCCRFTTVALATSSSSLLSPLSLSPLLLPLLPLFLIIGPHRCRLPLFLLPPSLPLSPSLLSPFPLLPLLLPLLPLFLIIGPRHCRPPPLPPPSFLASVAPTPLPHRQSALPVFLLAAYDPAIIHASFFLLAACYR